MARPRPSFLATALGLSACFTLAVGSSCGGSVVVNDEPGGGGAGGTTAASSSGSAGCLPAVGAADGERLLTLSTPLSPSAPVLFAATLTTADGGGTFLFSLSLAPLAAADRETVVAPPFDSGPFQVAAGGSFAASLPPLSVPGEANPISGTELEVTGAVLSGTLCAPADFICGDLTGDLTKPVTMSLQGSTFTLERVVGSYPEPPRINCDGDLADPL